MTGLPESNKGWKRLFIRMTNPTRFGVNLRWKVADANGNRAPSVMLEEHEDFDKLLGCKFHWQLVLDKGEIS